MTEYLDGVLPAATRARLETHLEECDGCERYLEQLRQTVRLTALLLGATYSRSSRSASQALCRPRSSR